MHTTQFLRSIPSAELRPPVPRHRRLDTSPPGHQVRIKLSVRSQSTPSICIRLPSPRDQTLSQHCLFVRRLINLLPAMGNARSNCYQRLCISSGGNSKRVTVPGHKTYSEKLNYKFTLNPAIDYAFCCRPFASTVTLSISPSKVFWPPKLSPLHMELKILSTCMV
jgi:hypothetical protein